MTGRVQRASIAPWDIGRSEAQMGMKCHRVKEKR